MPPFLPVFDAFLLAVHIPAGVIAVISGAGAMLSDKGSTTHRRRGRLYLGALAVVCLSGAGLVATRWPRFPHLLALGVVAAALAAVGYAARRRPLPLAHLAAMGSSYIAMLTAFYVDNGPKLPLWNLLPPISFWFLPSAFGIPIVVRAVRRRAARQPAPPERKPA
jgi:uncharacterized membrane protein